MGARHFVSGDHISFALGALNFPFGDSTIAIVCRRTATGVDHDPFSYGTGVDTALFIAGVDNSVRLFLGTSGGTGAVAGVTLLSTDGWAIIGAKKAGGAAVPRIWRYRYSDNSLAIGNAGASLNNSPTPDGSGEIGRDVGGGSDWVGDIYAIGVWDSLLSDAELSTLQFEVSFAAWNRFPALKFFTDFDHDPIQNMVDKTGNGADETSRSGTSVVSDTPHVIAGLDMPSVMPVGYLSSKRMR